MRKIEIGIYHLPTQELWDVFVLQATKQKYKWKPGSEDIPVSRYARWNYIGESSCIELRDTGYMETGCKNVYEFTGYKVELFQFDFSVDDLRSGDKIVYRCGIERWLDFEVGKVYHDEEMTSVAMRADWWMESYNSTMTHKSDSERDVVGVYRNKKTFWERKEHKTTPKENKTDKTPTLEELKVLLALAGQTLDSVENRDGYILYHLSMRILEHLEQAEKDD